MQNMENNSAIIEPTIDDISSETLEKVGDVIAKIRELPQDEFGKRNFFAHLQRYGISGFNRVEGSTRKDTFYNLARDGFSLMVT
ncbi:hypothetical protein IXZ18_05155 [Campylobacter fetus subsp. venerealis bv. intermedius]|uniref:hypothetical protein n=1 Tax=Campylobacter fetus TaxID=196 RepID=UPI0026DFA786|nr:hypothetical protein [Campylobacter fetus]WKW22058.1 hypothetical protein IXZ22_06480 [Campylobacter fetus subsp. venerealis]WKW23157.1 hypothetical protein IXZ22_01665 [Campylobacter fetus subsp. venerealis]WKW23593.1 hypothetical protein IXZ22_04130 [Campylobacter fetus subsp. venerealis]WKW27977.1 hypothetical protein IXZ24_05365 [Campylobacter fetus subsp. venerealis bv. intermedius]WKW30062.1 hypothetical protein IXZ18_05155 [Campylobacter fetus subsp. venerealis bv. intermedius]